MQVNLQRHQRAAKLDHSRFDDHVNQRRRQDRMLMSVVVILAPTQNRSISAACWTGGLPGHSAERSASLCFASVGRTARMVTGRFAGRHAPR